MSELVRSVVLRIVTYPEMVQVTEVEKDGVITVEIRVAPDDMGRVIGKGGRVINAIRTIAKAGASRDDNKVFVEVV
ncbi:MAG: KH domain-containing protein [Tissierellia bacterium]|nr:KH domain-containing protein [Tissierellia bacterium]